MLRVIYKVRAQSCVNFFLYSGVDLKVSMNLLQLNSFLDAYTFLFFMKISRFSSIFYNLLLKKWLFFYQSQKFYVVLYNYFIFKLISNAALLVANLLKLKKNVFFLTDKKVEDLIGFNSLNSLISKDLLPLCTVLTFDKEISLRESGEFIFYRFLSDNLSAKRFDFIVILFDNYYSLNRGDLAGIARNTMGLVDEHVNPNLFDFFIPVYNNKFFTLQIFKELLCLHLKM